jgi:hypothetical protein
VTPPTPTPGEGPRPAEEIVRDIGPSQGFWGRAAARLLEERNSLRGELAAREGLLLEARGALARNCPIACNCEPNFTCERCVRYRAINNIDRSLSKNGKG